MSVRSKAAICRNTAQRGRILTPGLGRQLKCLVDQANGARRIEAGSDVGGGFPIRDGIPIANITQSRAIRCATRSRRSLASSGLALRIPSALMPFHTHARDRRVLAIEGIAGVTVAHDHRAKGLINA